MAFKSIHKDEEAKKIWKTVFNVVYNFWFILICLRLLLRFYYGIKYEQSVGFDFYFLITVIWLFAYISLYSTYWIKPSWFRISKDQKVEGCDAPGVD